MGKLIFHDATLREGEQAPGVFFSPEEKLEIAHQLEKLGIKHLETGFPASCESEVQTTKLLARNVKNASLECLSRLKENDIDVSWESLKQAEDPWLLAFISTSDLHMKHKLNLTRSQLLETIASGIRYAKKYFPNIIFGMEDATRSDLEFLTKVVDTAIQSGASCIGIADTLGYSLPSEINHLINYLQKNSRLLNTVDILVHFHNDLGLAVANTIEAIRCGATRISCTVNGLGERAGNAAVEEIATITSLKSDYLGVTTDLAISEINNTCNLVSKFSNIPIPINKSIIGENMFKIESGVHQDGYLKCKDTYQLFDSKLIGKDEVKIVLGKHSGRRGLQYRISKLGITDLDDNSLKNVLKLMKENIKDSSEITDVELVNILKKIGINLVEK